MTDNLYLIINNNALSDKRAAKNVDELIAKFGFSPPLTRSQWSKTKYKFNLDGEQIELSYLNLFLSSKKYGVIEPIQFHIDRNDDIFGGISFGIGTPNHQLPLTINYAGYSKTLKSPSRTDPIEQELVNDILFYRQETCLESNNHDFEMSCRNYRAYLFTSFSIIDAFINRHILIYKQRKLATKDFVDLENSKNFDERIELFIKVSSSSDNLKLLYESSAWSDYKILKSLRNNIVHSIEPFFGHSIHEFAKHLNIIRTGVGELLKMLLVFQGKSSLGFIEKLRNAPEVYYNQITLKVDGNDIIKRIGNKN